ncbi:MAG: putative outer rane efflux protein [Pseudomonadota bacterium]
MTQAVSKSNRAGHAVLKPLALAVAALALSACSTIQPTPLVDQDLKSLNQADTASIRKDVEPISGPLTLDEAMARALKYNLERRTKMMEEAMALNQLDVNKYDMLPKLMAQAGYSTRNNERGTFSSPYPNGAISTSASTSTEATHNTTDLGFTWSLLDIGVGYYGSKQASDRVLIALERRRKAMHLLMQDVRTAYWRAVSAQKLQKSVADTIAMGEAALTDSRKAEGERVRNPLDALRYQRQLLENLRLLESITQELSSAQVELATLINAPIGQAFTLANEDGTLADDEVLKMPVQKLEEATLAQNADLREQHYNVRVASEEVRRTMARLFPNLSFNYNLKYDTDQYLVNNRWNEAGLQLSFNLFNLITGPGQKKLAEAGVALAEQRRMTMQLAVVTQMHLARLQLVSARNQFDRADAIYSTDQRIAEHVRNRASAQTASALDRVSNKTTAILSLLRRYQALAQVQAAENKLMATLGLEPRIGSTGEMSLNDLTQQLKANNKPWAPLMQTSSVMDTGIKVAYAKASW